MTQDNAAEHGDDVPIVKDPAAVRDAWAWGFEQFDRHDAIDEADPHGEAVSHFKESAAWANNVAPSLRAAAGYEDATGKGTYTADRIVVVIDEAEIDDEPAPGEALFASDVFGAVVEAFDDGTRAALAGDSKEPHRAVEDFAITF